MRRCTFIKTAWTAPWGWLLVCAILAAGCVSTPASYEERHLLNDVTVIFLDEERLQKEWERVTGDPAVAFRSNGSALRTFSLSTVRGFYDFRTRTIYCNKMDFEVCGHELHHAVLGRFHDDR